MKCWLDGEWVDSDVSAVSPMSHALHYGTGVFEGVRAYKTPRGTAIFRWPEHLSRMKAGAKAIGMELDSERITQAMDQVLQVNALESAYIRPLAFYGTGGLSLDVAQLRTHQMVAAMPWKSHLGASAVRLCVSSYRRNAADALPPLKLCGGYVNSILAKLEASRAGFGEALFLDAAGQVCEATGENVFWVKHGKVMVVHHPDALSGITRATLMELSGAEERSVGLEELMDADEIFLTGTSAEVASVCELQGQRWELGPVTRELQTLYQSIVHGERPEYDHWLRHVEVQANQQAI
jgi:branched-chain amino acid aminotransferase